MENILKKSDLFRGMSEEDIKHILSCLGSSKKTFRKNEYIFMEGETNPKVGIIISGNVQAIKETKAGGLILINQMKAGDIFGLSYVCAQTNYLPISIISIDKSEVLFIDLNQLVQTCRNACQFHINMIKNALWILAQKNLFLDTKMFYLSHKTIRERLITFLEEEENKANSPEFIIDFNREQLADFLCVDRSSLSRELSHLKDEGILDYKKNWFKIHR